MSKKNENYGSNGKFESDRQIIVETPTTMDEGLKQSLMSAHSHSRTFSADIFSNSSKYSHVRTKSLKQPSRDSLMSSRTKSKGSIDENDKKDFSYVIVDDEIVSDYELNKNTLPIIPSPSMSRSKSVITPKVLKFMTNNNKKETILTRSSGNKSVPMANHQYSKTLANDVYKSDKLLAKKLKSHETNNISSQGIRTDKVTGDRYRRLRSVSVSGNPSGDKFQYEKEVHNANSQFSTLSRNNSGLKQWLKRTSNENKESDNYKLKKELNKLNNNDENTLNTTMSTTLSYMSNEISKYNNKRLTIKRKMSEAQGYKWLGKSKSWKDELKKSASHAWRNEVIALLLLGVTITMIAFIVSQLTSYSWDLTMYFYNNESLDRALILLICLGIKSVFVFTAIFLTLTIAPESSGSGIPELKAILSGIWIRRYLSIRVLLVKMLALTCALSSGLPIGIEGPFIHMSASVARQITRLSSFKHIDRKTLLSAGCACSIGVIFAAPIGGVLFSIEVTHHYYKTSSYFSAFACAGIAALLQQIVASLQPKKLLLLNTSFDPNSYKNIEFIVFGFLGITAGILGAIYVRLHRHFTLRKYTYRSYKHRLFGNPYMLAFLVTSVYVICVFELGDFAFRPIRLAVSDLFNLHELTDCDNNNDTNDCNFTDWDNGLGVYWNLFMFTLINFVFSIFFLVLDWPCGCFASVFAIGASSGRLWGEALNDILLSSYNTHLTVGTYAVVGAASLVAGVTRTFSVAVIIMEMTKEVTLAIPILLAVILSWTISSWLSSSIYDSILELRAIPLLPLKPKNIINPYTEPPRPYLALDVMIYDFNKIGYLRERCTLRDIAIVLEDFDEIFYPILKTKKNTLIAEVSRQVLEDLLKAKGFPYGSEERELLLDPMYEGCFEPLNKHNSRNIHQTNSSLYYNIIKNDKAKLNNNNDIITLNTGTHINVKLPNNDTIKLTDSFLINHINLSPVQCVKVMPLTDVYLLFHVLHPDKIYVCERNILIGVIDEAALIERERSKKTLMTPTSVNIDTKNENNITNKNDSTNSTKKNIDDLGSIITVTGENDIIYKSQINV